MYCSPSAEYIYLELSVSKTGDRRLTVNVTPNLEMSTRLEILLRKLVRMMESRGLGQIWDSSLIQAVSEFFCRS